jgi:outer membrane protein assembly factor BamB
MLLRQYMTMALLVFGTGGMPPAAGAGDWPNWRGPHHNGISSERHWGGEWTTCTPRVRWTQEVGTGFSSSAVAEGRLYTMGNRELVVGWTKKAHDIVCCLDADGGEILWTHAYPAPLTPNSYEGGPSATPTVAAGRVYTLSKQGLAYCLDAQAGTVLWQCDLAAKHGVRAPTWGFAGSPYVHGDLVIYNVGTHGLALRTADGSLAWKTGTGRSGYSTPVPFALEGRHPLILTGETTFAAVEAETGKVLWEHPWVTSNQANIADPVVQDNLVFVSTGYQKGSALFEVTGGRVTQLWFQKNMQTFLNSAVLWQGYLYGPNDYGKALTCVERSTGRIMWTKTGFGNGSVTLADGKLIVLSQTGDLCLVKASPTGYQETGKGRILTGTCWSVPVLARGKIYARNALGTLVCATLETTAPKVNAGHSVVTWLKAGTTTVGLNGAVVDDTGDLATIRWSVLAAPPRAAVVLANPAAAATTATFARTGSYVLELYARDARAQEGSDRIEVRVYADSCEAARSNPLSAYVAPRYDADDDCREDFDDFAVWAARWLGAGDLDDLSVFAEQWLQNRSLTAEILFDAEEVAAPPTNPQ